MATSCCGVVDKAVFSLRSEFLKFLPIGQSLFILANVYFCCSKFKYKSASVCLTCHNSMKSSRRTREKYYQGRWSWQSMLRCWQWVDSKLRRKTESKNRQVSLQKQEILLNINCKKIECMLFDRRDDATCQLSIRDIKIQQM